MEGKIQKKENNRNDALKIIGIVTTAVDHVGFILYPQIIFLRVIGRLAFPIFAWYLAEGYVHTSSRKKYAMRLGIFAVATQAPYYLATHLKNLNIFFTLLVGLFAIDCFRKNRYISTVTIILLSGLIPLDYSFYGVLMILGFYIFRESKVAFYSQVAINIAGFYLFGFIQLFSLFGAALAVYFPKNFPKIQINKYFFYFFYPAHLAIIYGLSQLPLFAK
jgi:hypothetical protein